MEGLTHLNAPVSELMQVKQARLARFPSWQCVAMLLLFYSPGILFVLASNPAFAFSPAVSDISSPEEYLAQGWRWFQQGAFDQAITSWMEATRLYGRAGKPNKQTETLTYLSQAYQSIGQYRQALQNLESALALVQKSDDRMQMASVLGSLGNVYIATGPAETAHEYLSAGLSTTARL
jgi:tetratricopeptide (TPR) repeat protein